MIEQVWASLFMLGWFPSNPDSCWHEQGERLAEWVRSNGGYVHQSLALSDVTDCGARCVRRSSQP